MKLLMKYDETAERAAVSHLELIYICYSRKGVHDSEIFQDCLHTKGTPVHARCFYNLRGECSFTVQVLAALCSLIEHFRFLNLHCLVGHADVKYEVIKIGFIRIPL